MSTMMQSARGASAFTASDDSLRFPAEEANSCVGDQRAASETLWKDLVDDLLRIRMLNDDWDGQGAEAPHPDIIAGAITLTSYLKARNYPPADRVIAGVNGTVYFEWYSPEGYQEIEVTSPLDAEKRWVAKGSDKAEVVCFTHRS